MHPPSFSEFQQLAMHGNVIPMAESLLADLVTPVAAYLKLCGPDGDGFLLESVEGGEAVGRYSFLGHAPRQLIGFDGRHVTITRDGAAETVGDHLFTYLQEHQRRYRFVPNPDLPRFSGGLVGFFGYDTVRQLENLPERHAPGDRPEASFGLYDTILAFDHLRHQILVITNVILEEGEDLKAAYQAGLDRIAATRESLSRPLDLTPFAGNGHADVSSSFSEKAFTAAVNTAKRHIRAGDIFQVVLSQQFSRKVSAPPIDIYRALRLVNPSPYLYYLKNGDHHVIGSSPEMLVRVDGGEITVRPIAGTRPRGRGPEEDQRLGEELLADEKERAEHVMLVDLGRNDVGRAADYGSVRLTENMIVERYSHVMHIVSEVKGRLRPGMDAIDAFTAAFPAGTVSGAPKVRAMEIIEELEPHRRGLYSGALGYLDFSGNLDTCITIRTLEVQDGIARFQAGAGIVADSVPEREYQETIHKSNAIRTAIAMAEGGLSSV